MVCKYLLPIKYNMYIGTYYIIRTKCISIYKSLPNPLSLKNIRCFNFNLKIKKKYGLVKFYTIKLNIIQHYYKLQFQKMVGSLDK